MNADLAQSILAKVSPFAWNFLDIRHMAGGKQLKVFLKNLDNRDLCEQYLKEYHDQFARIDFVCNDETVIANYLNRIDFLAFRASLSQYIQAAIETLQSWDPSDPIYAFVLAVFPSECLISYTINTESAWLSKLERSRRSVNGETTLYTDPFKYCCAEFTATSPDPDQDTHENLWKHCDSMKEVCSEFYEISGNDHAGITFYQNFLRRFMQMTVHALRENMPAFGRIPVTDDFVAYVEDYTGSGDPFFTMMETIPLPILREIWGKSYPNIG
ncbi:MAG: hypothetical protein J0M04_00155 [Verrucomicrobia bacterium]|nr:hypothetical protein [Verrucomicrobiota bacterium]